MSSTQDATSQYIKHRGIRINKTMDVTFVLEESGVTATVEVPCEADVAAAKEVACTALAVSPASVEMRIGTQVLEGTCRLQDTAFGAGVQVVLARRFASIKCPAEFSLPLRHLRKLCNFSLSPCGTLCLYYYSESAGCNISVVGFDTETFVTAFKFGVAFGALGPPAISRCKTRCYLACQDWLLEVALPGGEVLRKVESLSTRVFACGGVVVSESHKSVSVYDEDLTLLRSLSQKLCFGVAVSDCGGWVITSSWEEKNARLWDVNTGEAVACVPADGGAVAISRSVSVFAAVCYGKAQLYDWSGAALGCFVNGQLESRVFAVQFTPCGKYVVVGFVSGDFEVCSEECTLHQYDVATMSCVRVIRTADEAFAISPCSRVILFDSGDSDDLVSQHLYPHFLRDVS